MERGVNTIEDTTEALYRANYFYAMYVHIYTCTYNINVYLQVKYTCKKYTELRPITLQT